MINNVVLTGRITKDHDLRYTSQSNMATVRFTLAVNRRVPNKQTGQREADFISCTAFGKTAEILAQYTRKGSLIGVEGSIRTGRYENQQGQTVFTTDVIVNTFTFLESNQQGGNQQGGQSFGAAQPNGYTNQTPPQASNPTSAQPDFSNNNQFAGGEQAFDISDDDLPF